MRTRREVGLMGTASSPRKRFSAPSSTFFPGPGDCGVACSANRSAEASSRPFPSVPRTSSPPAASRGTTTATTGTASPPWHREGPWPTSSGPRCRRRRRCLLGFGAQISSQPCLLLLLTTSQRGKQRSQARRCESACRLFCEERNRKMHKVNFKRCPLMSEGQHASFFVCFL